MHARRAAPTIIALFGPTGVGKTSIALSLAELLRAEGEDPVAVSADALQVYAGLATLTGIAPRRSRPFWKSPGVVPPTRRAVQRGPVRGGFAHAEIDALLTAGQRPIVVGGQGLYLRAALADLDLRPPPPEGARETDGRTRTARGARPAPIFESACESEDKC